MIFDNGHITKLVRNWKISESNDTLEEILDGCKSLVEVIVSKFDQQDRDDLIQECYIRIRYSLKYYQEDIGDLHKYFTSVITNTCISYVNKARKQLYVDLSEYDVAVDGDEHKNDAIEVLIALIVRNRERFPSLQTHIVDGMTERIFYYIRDGIYGKSRGAIAKLTKEFKVSRSKATVVYHSSLAYLRRKYLDDTYVTNADECNEFSITMDLQELVGKDAYDVIAIVFAGMYMKFP